MLPTTILLHTASTLAMVGLIWFVQLVHYPLFDRVARDRFTEFELAHSRRTTWIVMPLMLIELATALLLFRWVEDSSLRGWLIAGAALLAVLWLSTAFVQVPAHRRLTAGFDAAAHRRLVSTHWIRTVGWSARGGIALLLQARLG